MAHDEKMETFSHDCRCGGQYKVCLFACTPCLLCISVCICNVRVSCTKISNEELECGDEIVCCDSCSLCIRVLYEAVEED